MDSVFRTINQRLNGARGRTLLPLLFAALIAGAAAAEEALTMPGFTLPIEAPLAEELKRELDAKDASYQPRTDHLLNEGQPRFINRLIRETSPYLQQHAHNPVNWYPWGEEALQQARRENKPIFLSIGYATCHWCHVMERESFENLSIATELNQHFISIKVDREQLPELDSLYMLAAGLISGQAGWPLTALLTPEGHPFFAASYFPPDAFSDLIRKTRQQWQQNRDELRASADDVQQRIQALMAPQTATTLPGQETIERAVQYYTARFDEFNGGFGTAPKFPRETVLRLLLNQAVEQREAALLGTVQQTLDAIQQGGIHDQIGGGFHRYAIDPEWQIPHFEKMLYNQAALSELYLDAWLLTGNPLYRRTLVQTLDYVLAELQAPEGGFYAATDADSESKEGTYFIWEMSELRQLLTPADFSLTHALFGISRHGNFEGKNVLYLPLSLPEFARKQQLTSPRLLAQIDRIRQQLLTERRKRIPPALDDKVITGWNGMMIAALARAGHLLHEPRYLAAAWQAAERLWQQASHNSAGLRRDLRGATPGAPATQEDYAQLALAMIVLYDTSGDVLWLSRAEELATRMLALFSDDSGGSLFLSTDDSLSPVRMRSMEDSATPSGNAVAYQLLTSLAERRGDSRFSEQATRLLSALSAPVDQAPEHFSYLLSQVRRAENIRYGTPAYGANGALHAEVVRQADRFHLRIRLQEGWHINGHAPDDKRLIGAGLSTDDGQISAVAYPDGEALNVAFSPRPVEVYSGQFEISGQIGSAIGDSLPPVLTFRFQACSDRTCLPPEQVRLQLPATH